MIKDRVFSFFIDIFLIKLIVVLIGNLLSINAKVEDIIFLSAYSSYYIFSNIIFRKTLGKKMFYLKSVSEREKDDNYIESWFIVDIILKYVFILPVMIMFTDYASRVFMVVCAIYYVYFSISEKVLHDRFTKIKVEKEEWC